MHVSDITCMPGEMDINEEALVLGSLLLDLTITFS
jgi:hypothetical protein